MSNFLTVKELSSFLSLHPNTIYKMAEHQEIPFIKRKGVGIRFRKKDIEEWLDKGSLKINSFIESFSKFDLSLDRYDRLFLKGGRMSHKERIWKYPFGSVYLRLTKTGKERWYIYYRANGERIRQVVKNAQSRTDALKVLQVNVADVFRGEHGFRKQEKDVKFSEFADLYLANARPNKKSWKQDQYRIEAHLKPYFGKLDLKEVTSLLIEKYRVKRLKAGIKKSTSNRELALLKVMFSRAIDWDYCTENPSRKVKFFSEKDNLKERILNLDEEQRLLEASAEHLKPMLITALYTGMRRGEILSLEWRNVDLTKRLIRVEKTKNGKIRFIPINDLLLNELAGLKMNNGGSDYVFLYPKTHNPVKDVKTAFNAAKRRAGIKDLRFHDLRHTFASRLIESGVDIITVKDLLGHCSVETTQRYTHSRADQKMKAVQSLVKKEVKIHEFVPVLSTRKKELGPNVLFSAN